MKITTAVGLLLIAALLSLIPGCGDDKPSGLILGDFAYPLQVGQIWKYSGRQYNFNFRPESLAPNHSETNGFISTVQVMQKTRILDTLEVYSFKETAIEGGMYTYTSWNYFNNRPDGFYSYAYGGTSPMMQPRKIAPRQHQLMFHGRRLEDIQTLLGTSLINHSMLAPKSDSLSDIEEPPFRCLKYPLTAGSEWLVRARPEIVPIKKKVIDQVRVQVPAGIFTCAKIQWLYDIGSDGTWDEDVEAYDYISQMGLVKRNRIYRNVEVTTHEYPLGIGTCDIAEVWELTQGQSGE